MSVTVECQYTGIEFEAATKRSKNHPVIANVLNQAYSDGWRDQALTAIQAGREAGFTKIAEYVSLLKETELAAKAGEDAQIEKRVLEFRQRKADAAARNWQPKEHADNISNRENDNYLPNPVGNVTTEPEW